VTNLRILCLYPLPGDALDRIARLPGVTIERRDLAPGQTVDDLDLVDVDILFNDWPPADVTHAPRLRWVAAAGAGIEYLLDRSIPTAVTVTNGSGLHGSSMGEYCLGAILFAAQRNLVRQEHQGRHAWEPRDAAFGRRLRDQTLAVLGYGSIGREVARLARAFGMRILAVKTRPGQVADEGFAMAGLGDPEGTIPERIVGLDGLHGVLSEADFIVISLPLTPHTRGLFGREALAACRSTAWLVKIGRGPIIDEQALLAALREGRIGGAYLDVFDEEPLPADHAYWDAPNLVISPHIAGVNSHEHFWRMLSDLLEQNVRRYVAGEPLLNRVDLARGY
jgi:phosphoglycerate dehydrogenase-like enzyme